MKNSAIKEIYYDSGSISEKIEESKEYWDLIHRISDLTLKLEKDFTDEQKEIFKEIDHLEAGVESEIAFTYFKKGFKLGLCLGLEIDND